MHIGRPAKMTDEELRAYAQKLYDNIKGGDQPAIEAFCPGEGPRDNSCSSRGGSGEITSDDLPDRSKSSGVEEINDVRVYRNPTLDAAKKWLAKYGPIRGMTNQSTGETFIWPANKAWHVEVAQALGFGEGELQSRTGQTSDRDLPNRWHAMSASDLDRAWRTRKQVAVKASGWSEGEFILRLQEAFCPTGEGQGQDNSCPPSNKGDGEQGQPHDERGATSITKGEKYRTVKASARTSIDQTVDLLKDRGYEMNTVGKTDLKSGTTTYTLTKNGQSHEVGAKDIAKFLATQNDDLPGVRTRTPYNEGDPVESKGKTRALGEHPSDMKPEVAKAFHEAEAKYPPVDPDANDTFLRQVVSLDDKGNPKFTPEREALHQGMVDEVRAHVRPATGQPEFVLMGGGPASGKSSLLEQGRVDLDPETVKLNVDDDFKFKIPEYAAMTRAGDPMAAAVAHEESSHLAKRAMSESFAAKQNVSLDGTGDGSEKSVLKKVAEARAAGYKVRAEYVTKPIGDAIAWAEKRARETGRAVPRTVLENTHRAVAKIVPKLIAAGAFDQFRLWDTGESEANPDRPGKLRAKVRLVAQAEGTNLKIVNAELWKKFLARAEAGVMEARMAEQPDDMPRWRQREIIAQVARGITDDPQDTNEEAAFRKAITADVDEMRGRGVQAIDFENDLD